jgi:hypothetical protein
MKSANKPSVLVLGAGIQGICVALALRCRGYLVTVIDQMPDLMLRTSLRNEGKIHLGFVYANDPSFQTSALLLNAALQFGPLLEDWLGMSIDWAKLTSSPFLYLIARDSMLAPDEICAHYERLQECLNERIASGERAVYLGNDLRGKNLWQPANAAVYKWFAPARVAECVETVEVALSREPFRQLVKARLETMPEIETRYGHHIETIERRSNGFYVQGSRTDGTRWDESAEIVVNCLWDGRLVLDQQLGITPRRAFVMRLKYRLLGELAPALRTLPSLTMVLGRYGDIVRYEDEPTYFSWYPTCLRGWSQTITPPEEWNAVCAGKPEPGIAETVARETLDAFDEIVPGIRNSQVQHVDGGVIYSWGETDIDDHASALHSRHEIGFTAHDGYFSVDTGKFTSAPLFAQQLADALP